MEKQESPKKRLSIQLNKDEEWLLDRAHDLARLRRGSIRKLIVQLLIEESARQKATLAAMEKSRAA